MRYGKSMSEALAEIREGFSKKEIKKLTINTAKQKYQNSLLQALPLKLFQLLKTETHASFIFIRK